MPSLEWRASHGDCCALRGRVFSERVTSGRGCMNSRRFTASSILGVREAVMAGAGLNAGPLWLYADAIDRGELIAFCRPGTRRGIRFTRSCKRADIDPRKPIARSPCCE